MVNADNYFNTKSENIKNDYNSSNLNKIQNYIGQLR